MATFDIHRDTDTNIQKVTASADAQWTQPFNLGWAPHVWDSANEPGSHVIFTRLDTPAIAGFAHAFANAGHMYLNEVDKGSVAIYAVLHIKDREASAYQAMISRDPSGEIVAAYDDVVGPMNIPAPAFLQETFQDFITAANQY